VEVCDDDGDVLGEQLRGTSKYDDIHPPCNGDVLGPKAAERYDGDFWHSPPL
jgi:hypothetical protein